MGGTGTEGGGVDTSIDDDLMDWQQLETRCSTAPGSYPSVLLCGETGVAPCGRRCNGNVLANQYLVMYYSVSIFCPSRFVNQPMSPIHELGS